mmetsp:Transcript_153369/g.372421  ORF Transcript_153369/g.372421 Transcript_153369/m.372421 type:complete len:245 (+) Transcript_153369:813-1547(+)
MSVDCRRCSLASAVWHRDVKYCSFSPGSWALVTKHSNRSASSTSMQRALTALAHTRFRRGFRSTFSASMTAPVCSALRQAFDSSFRCWRRHSWTCPSSSGTSAQNRARSTAQASFVVTSSAMCSSMPAIIFSASVLQRGAWISSKCSFKHVRTAPWLYVLAAKRSRASGHRRRAAILHDIHSCGSKRRSSAASSSNWFSDMAHETDISSTPLFSSRQARSSPSLAWSGMSPQSASMDGPHISRT